MQKDKFQVRHFPDLKSFQAKSAKRSLRICIATEEIVGPVRNGGIASTYYHLARMLVDDGHQVTVLYLNGQRCENKYIEYWVKWYAQMGIDFVALPFESIPQKGFAPFWQRRFYAFYRWLSEQEPPFDVVHTSEWRGGAFYVLGAKRLGLEFQNTLFLVKSSSPHIWNRHYQMQTIENNNMLACSHAEQKVIEWADIVIGGSAHLLSFMEWVGYQLPEGRIYVQPNVIDLQDLNVKESRPDYQYAERVKADELVFFGRLEARKGLEIFCDALDQLALEGPRPQKVYFLGKQGQNMPTFPDMKNIEYIKTKAANWPFEIEVLSDLDQQGAISFLCAKPCIAVMPSIIENSTMAVYEALVHKIPFLATNVGGTPELIAPEFHQENLTEPHPGILAKDLRRVLEHGGTVAKASFDYKENMAVWRGFHRWLSDRLAQESVDKVISELSYDPAALASHPRPTQSIKPSLSSTDGTQRNSLAAIVYHWNDPYGLRLTLKSLLNQKGDAFDEIVVITDGQIKPEDRDSYQALKNAMDSVTFLELAHQCVGPSYNAALEYMSQDVALFFRAGKQIANQDMVRLLRRAFSHEHVRLAAAVYDCVQDPTLSSDRLSWSSYRYLPMGGDIAAHLLHDGALGGPCFAVRKELVLEKGGFASAYHVSHVEAEFLARCVMQGEELWVVPKALYEFYDNLHYDHYNYESGNYLRILPVFDSMSYSLKRLFLRVGHVYGNSNEQRMLVQHQGSYKKPRFNVLSLAQKGDMSGIGMGLLFDPKKQAFACILRKKVVDDKASWVSVKAHSTQIMNLPLENLGEDYLVAKWNFKLMPPEESLSIITFVCNTASSKFIRSVSAIWGNDETIHIASLKPLVVGDIDEKNAEAALPSETKHNIGSKADKKRILKNIMRPAKRCIETFFRKNQL